MHNVKSDAHGLEKFLMAYRILTFNILTSSFSQTLSLVEFIDDNVLLYVNVELWKHLQGNMKTVMITCENDVMLYKDLIAKDIGE